MNYEYINISSEEENYNETTKLIDSKFNNFGNSKNNIINLKYNKSIRNEKFTLKKKFVIFISTLLSIGIILGFFNYKDIQKQNDKNDKPVPLVEEFNSKNSIYSKLNINIDNNSNINCDYSENTELVLTKGKSRIDKNGIDLNKYILNGMYSQAIDNIPDKKINEWSLYTPSSPLLKPIKRLNAIVQPSCEDNSLQFVNYTNGYADEYPHYIRLYEISNTLENYKNWETQFNNEIPNYDNKSISDNLGGFYHPYDYGFTDDDTNQFSTNEYFKNIISKDQSFDKIPDPRNRKLYSFISFDFEFELLDIYLSENYDVVDYFVIFETNTTTAGVPKPLYFTRMLLETDRYESFKDKLIPLPYIIPENEDKNETKEDLIDKIMIEEGLRAVSARHGDLFIYGGVGEIAKAHVLARLKKCGGWEHLCSGIGSVLTDSSDEKNIKIQKMRPLPFSTWSYQYSFGTVENNKSGSIHHLNLGIFDVRHSLVQLSKENSPKKRSSSSSDLDIYKSYVKYNDFKEINELNKSDNSAVLWSAGWYMDSILPSINHLYHKLLNTNPELACLSENKVKYEIENAIINKETIFSDQKLTLMDYYPKLPKNTQMDDFSYDFHYAYWKRQKNGPSLEFIKFVDALKKEIPYQVGTNTIVYNYMFDRKFGVNKKLWWKYVPQKEWGNYAFNYTLEKNKKQLPWISPFNLDDLQIMSAEETIRDIVKNRKSIARYGDGEYSMMIRNQLLCSYQTRDDKLIEKLESVLRVDDKNFIIGIPDTFKDSYIVLRTDAFFWYDYINYQRTDLAPFHNLYKVYGSAMISRYYNEMKDKSGVQEYIKLLRTIWEEKDILIVEGKQTRFGYGNDLLNNTRSIERILCPVKDAFAVYDDIYNEVLKHDKNKTVLISLGPTATVLAYDLFKAGYQAIDIGHADIEYEWYQRKTDNRIKIDYKYVNEALNGTIDIADVDDEAYTNQIVGVVELKHETSWYENFINSIKQKFNN